MKITGKRGLVGGAGFSLIEMLVVIAVIGLIAAIAVPTLGNMTRSADDGRAKRNAQNLAAVSAVAISAGASVDFSDVDSAVQDIRDGVMGVGDFSETIFQVHGLSADEVTAAKGHLQIAGGALEYVP